MRPTIAVTIRQRRGTQRDPDWVVLEGIGSDATAYAIETARCDQAEWLRSLAQGRTDPHPRLPYHTRRGLQQYLFKMVNSGADATLTGILVAGRDWRVFESGQAINLRLAYATFDHVLYCDASRLNEGDRLIIGGLG